MTDIDAVASIAARIDRLPVSGLVVRARLTIGLVTFFDGFDQLLIAYALPSLRAHYHLSTVATTILITVGSVGMLCGALLTGRLADRFGRVRVVGWCLAVYSLASVLAACSPTLEILELSRFLQGIGIGGEVLVAATYVSEIVGPGVRGRFVLLYELLFVAGLAVASVVSTWVVPNFGWRLLFFLGAAPLLLLPWVRRVPESPRWLVTRGRDAEAEAVVERFESAVRREWAELPPIGVSAKETAELTSLDDVFRGRYLRRTLVVSVLWFVAFLVNYGLTSWLPTIYTSIFHLDVQISLLYSMITTIVGFAGCVLIALTVDRVGRRAGLIGGLIGSALVLAAAALFAPSTAVGVLGFVSVAAFFVFAVNLALNLYGPELYPTRSRAAGTSVGGVFARLGVIVGPIITGVLVGTEGGVTSVFAALALASVVGGVTVAAFGIETARRPLESLSP